jgi:GT2 family glycosyltransferase
MKQIAVLITCHNRRDKTLKCLKALYDQNELGIDFSVNVFLVDDGSTDGTAEAIMSQFPKVAIIQGDGNLYWNRGMHLAWKTAADTKDFDYYLWLNDDTFLNKKAVSILLQQSFSKAIVCGTTKSIQDDKATYGGYKKNPYRLLIPNGEFQECDYCNGNFVLIPRDVFQIVGNLDPIFQHALGDFDYGFRARKLGILIYTAPFFIGTCENNTETPKWRSLSISPIARVRSLYSASSGCHPFEFYVIDSRQNGIFTAIFHFITIHLRAIAPFMWKD